MTISYREWKAKSIEKMTMNTQKQIESLNAIGMNTMVLRLGLMASIENLHSKETLIYFLNNTEKCIRELEEEEEEESDEEEEEEESEEFKQVKAEIAEIFADMNARKDIPKEEKKTLFAKVDELNQKLIEIAEAGRRFKN
jgi:CO dehydrogenase/acetyl-CoA synthase beta subunit